jgi:hypothetical protein
MSSLEARTYVVPKQISEKEWQPSTRKNQAGKDYVLHTKMRMTVYSFNFFAGQTSQQVERLFRACLAWYMDSGP